jgi:hypothetical protein
MDSRNGRQFRTFLSKLNIWILLPAPLRVVDSAPAGRIPSNMEMESPNNLRRENTASRLPYRKADLHIQRGPESEVSTKHGRPDSLAATHANRGQQHQDRDLTNVSANSTTTHNTRRNNIDRHNRNYSTSTIAVSTPRKQVPRPLTFPLHDADRDTSISTSLESPAQKPSNQTSTKTRWIPASHSRNGLVEDFYGPPPAMITQGSYKIDTTLTTDWVASQQQQPLDVSPTCGDGQPLSARSATDSSGSRPLIKPIRGFKPSSRKSAEMASRRISTDQDSTIRGLDGYNHSKRASNQTEQDEHNSDDSDLFLRAAREEELTRQPSHGNGDSLSRTDSRMVRYRHSLFHIASIPSLYFSSSSFKEDASCSDIIINIILVVPNRTTSIPSSLESLLPILKFSSTWIRPRGLKCITHNGRTRKHRTGADLSFTGERTSSDSSRRHQQESILRSQFSFYSQYSY